MPGHALHQAHEHVPGVMPSSNFAEVLRHNNHVKSAASTCETTKHVLVRCIPGKWMHLRYTWYHTWYIYQVYNIYMVYIILSNIYIYIYVTDRVRRIGRRHRNTDAMKDAIPLEVMHERSHRTRYRVVRGPQHGPSCSPLPSS